MNDDLTKILHHYGPHSQIIKTIEELSELIQALSKDLNSIDSEEEITNQIIEEMADCYIMLGQMSILFEAKFTVLNRMHLKIARTLQAINTQIEDAEGLTSDKPLKELCKCGHQVYYHLDIQGKAMECSEYSCKCQGFQG